MLNIHRLTAHQLTVTSLTLLLSIGAAQAQAATLSLSTAIQQAIQRGPDVASSRTTLDNARADLKSKEADPSTLIAPLTQARQTAELNRVQYEAKRLETAQSVTSAYLNLYEGQQQVTLLQAQVDLDSRAMDVARAKLQAKNGTQLDVSRAESTLASSKQSLADARSQLPILSNRLEVLLGTVVSGNLSLSAPPSTAQRTPDQAALNAGLETRLPSVLQAAQSVWLNELNLKLSDNDYTAPNTLRDTRTSLENARRSLDTNRKNAVTSLQNALRQVQDSAEKVRIARANLANAEKSLSQDQTKYKAGTISRYQVQQTEVSAINARHSLLQTQNAYLNALTSLATASGVDVGGLLVAGN